MSKPLKIIAVVAGAVALAATGLGLIMGPAAFAAAFGTSAATIAGIASAVSAASVAATMPLLKPPDGLAA